ncbi:MAG: flavodoxin [Bacteroidota bacterium]
MMKSMNAKAMVLVIAICLFSFCSHAQNTTVPMPKFTGDQKILIVYLSRTNNTKAIAEIIRKNTGGDVVAIELLKPYPQDYKTTVAQVEHENETGYLPPLKTKIDGMGKYDVIFVGFPTWGMQLPPPMKSFLHQYNLAGKTIIPFNTNAGYGIGTSFQTVKSLCPNSKVLEGFTMKGGIERDGELLVIKGDYQIQAETDVKKWLAKLPITSNNGR